MAHPLSDEPLPYRTIMDTGIEFYGEFACSHSTLSWLEAEGIPKDNGQPCRLQVMEECEGGHNVIVKVWPNE